MNFKACSHQHKCWPQKYSLIVICLFRQVLKKMKDKQIQSLTVGSAYRKYPGNPVHKALCNFLFLFLFVTEKKYFFF